MAQRFPLLATKGFMSRNQGVSHVMEGGEIPDTHGYFQKSISSSTGRPFIRFVRQSSFSQSDPSTWTSFIWANTDEGKEMIASCPEGWAHFVKHNFAEDPRRIPFFTPKNVPAKLNSTVVRFEGKEDIDVDSVWDAKMLELKDQNSSESLDGFDEGGDTAEDTEETDDFVSFNPNDLDAWIGRKNHELKKDGWIKDPAYKKEKNMPHLYLKDDVRVYVEFSNVIVGGSISSASEYTEGNTNDLTG